MHFLNYVCDILKRILLNLIHFPKNLAKVMCGCLKVVWHYTCRLFCCCFGCFRRKKIKSIDLQGVGDYMKTCKNVIVMTGAGISTNAGIPDFRSESFGLYNRLKKVKKSKNKKHRE